MGVNFVGVLFYDDFGLIDMVFLINVGVDFVDGVLVVVEVGCRSGFLVGVGLVNE